MMILLPLLLSVLQAAPARADTIRIQNPEIPAEVLPFVQRLPGSYRITNPWSNTQGVFELKLRGNRLTMESAVDISGRDCGAKAVELVSLSYNPGPGGQVDPDAAIDAYFKLEKGVCRWIDGDVANFHFNKTVFNTDVYLIDVLINEGPRGRNGRRNGTVQRWSLKKES